MPRYGLIMRFIIKKIRSSKRPYYNKQFFHFNSILLSCGVCAARGSTRRCAPPRAAPVVCRYGATRCGRIRFASVQIEKT